MAKLTYAATNPDDEMGLTYIALIMVMKEAVDIIAAMITRKSAQH